MTYQLKHAPEVYLSFLNKSLYLTRDLSNKVSFRIFISSKMIEFLGDSLEECLDQAIIETGFDTTISASCEDALIMKLYRLIQACHPNNTLSYFGNTGGFTDSERSLLNQLIKKDFEKGFKEAGLGK